MAQVVMGDSLAHCRMLYCKIEVHFEFISHVEFLTIKL